MSFTDLNDSLIAHVRQSADIVDFVNQVTPLKVAGKSHKGLCPFHREKTPSFHVDRAKGLFYCFGCRAGGDVFKFLMLTERFTFPEAVEYVANRVGIQLPKKKSKGREADKDDLLEILAEASEAFHQALGWTPNAAEKYLVNRQVEPSIWAKYGFGYAPDSWDYILTRLGRKYPPERLEAAGLVLPRKKGEGYYDRFRNRLIVPIHSEGGNVIGFGGRTLDGSDPKYLNSPESPIFNKSNLLFNLHRAKDQIRKLERAILVEGYFDCITLDHSGVSGVVASMGTSLTPGQASVLRRCAPRVVIAYDGDNAGRNATLRAAPILLAAGLDVDVLDVGSGYDPDTYLRQNGYDSFLELLGNARDLFDFALDVIVGDANDLTGREKSEKLEALAQLVSAVSDPVIRNDAAQKIAQRLRLEFEVVWSRVRGRKPITAEIDRPVAASVSTGERRLLGAILNGQLPETSIPKIRIEFFEDEACKTIFGAAKESISSGQPLDFSALATHLRGETELTRLSELAFETETDEPDPTSFEDTIRLMERRFLDRRLKELQIEIQQAIREGDDQKAQSLDLEKIEVSRQYHALK